MKLNRKELPSSSISETSLTYPKDKFSLISIDAAEEWDARVTGGVNNDGTLKKKIVRHKATYITLRCNKCGSVKNRVKDSPDISCKIGPCNVRWVDLTGRVFGQLTVVEPVLCKISNRERVPHWRWKCICSCGNECLKTEHDLISMHYHRCPQCGRRASAEANTLPGKLSKWNRMIRNYKKNAKSRGRDFSLSNDEFIKIATSKCSYCGAEPRETGYGVVCNGIDRIDNSGGYTPGNVSSCCTRCNIMKGNMSRDEFLDHISKIVKTCGVRFNDYPCGEYAKAGGNEELPF